LPALNRARIPARGQTGGRIDIVSTGLRDTTAIAVDADSGVAYVSDLSGQIWAVSLDGPEEYIVARVDGDLADIAGA
jgi:hypothetical protein